jgi:hypothetical protein
LSKRGILRVAVGAAGSLAAAGAVSVGTALPAQASECATQGHVYVTSVSPWSIRYESQPLNGGTDDYQMFAASATTFRVGGNGLQRYTTPTWTVSSSTGAQFSFAGRAAGGNCVANETWVTVPARTQSGEVWTVSATYQGRQLGPVRAEPGALPGVLRRGAAASAVRPASAVPVRLRGGLLLDSG